MPSLTTPPAAPEHAWKCIWEHSGASYNPCPSQSTASALGVRTNPDYGGGWPIFALHHSHGGCPILAFFARVGGDAAGATLVRSTPPVVYAVVVPALRPREERGTRICGGFCSLKARPPAPPTLRFPERTGVALRSDLAHDNHQNSNFLFRLR